MTQPNQAFRWTEEPRWWSDKEARTVRRMIAEERSCSEIGRVLNRTRNAVIGFCHRNGIELHGHRPATRQIAAAEIAKMKILRRNGWSVDRIAEVTGRSKKSVSRHTKRDANLAAIAKLRRQAQTLNRSRRSIKGVHQKGSEVKMGQVPENAISLMETGDGLNATCRYIYGDPRGKHGYCPERAKEGSSYCEAHHAVCYVHLRGKEAA